MEFSELRVLQADGGPPMTLAAGSASGESGVSVLGLRFRNGAHVSAVMRKHVICFQLSPGVHIDCHIGGRTLGHAPPAGALAICPSGIDWSADTGESVESLLVAIDPGQLALAAAEDAALDAQLMERLTGYDEALLALARTLASESAAGYPSGPLLWNDVASAFIDRLVSRHTSAFRDRTPRALDGNILERVRDYVMAHLDQPIEVAALAEIAGRSPFHFSRVFARSVGMSPHRYVVRLRLRRAVELIRGAETDLADIAARTGFSDQSHLSRWVRRVYGVSPTQLVA
jgi:AraC family transcriptional regulator